MALRSRPTQEFIPIKEIRDGVVLLKNGEMRMVLLATSINFALKSADEQMAILLQFQSFLNSLDFSVQISIQSRRLDVRPYLTMLDERLNQETNEMMRIQIKEYIQFIRTFTDATNIMSKMFFIVVPYADPGAAIKDATKGLFSTKKTRAETDTMSAETFSEARSQLEQRASIVEQGLSRTGVQIVPLGTEELTELYYKIFNPGDRETPVA
ncbi:MAG: TraC family protein [Minisyncoccota bacterium]